jgi:hypothetical protein
MKNYLSFLICLIFLIFNIKTYCQEKRYALSFTISVADEIRLSFNQKGRLFLFISTNPDEEPRLQMGPQSITKAHYVFAKNFSDWKASEILTINDSKGWSQWARFEKYTFENIPEGTYYIQLLWDQNFEECGINAAGNIYSKKQELVLTSYQNLHMQLSELIEVEKLIDHKLVKLVSHQSDTLSKWWGKPVYERAAVFLPSRYYENPGKEYPIRYHIGGGFSPYYRANNLITDTVFYNWWLSDDAPQIITVFLDGTLNGNLYHIDSDNFGPYGYSLINEFVPYVENLYRGTNSPDTRFTDGCSTGGYGSFALQLFYPEIFNGVFCYSPDPISFWTYFTANIYEDDNLFYDQYGYDRFVRRAIFDDRTISMKDWIQFENVMGHSGTYIDSDHEFGFFTSMFGPKGTDGLPVPLFDPVTGIIDSVVAEKWRRYDLIHYVEDNWGEIGSKLQGKIYIWSGTNDEWSLDIPVYFFDYNFSRLENPKPDAVFEYSPNCGHCEKYSHKRILEQIAEKLDKMDKE